MKPSLARFAAYSFCFLLGFGGGIAFGGSPRDELLRLVPDDSTFTLLIQNLADKGKALEDSPFYKELEKSPFGKLILNPGDPDTVKGIEQLMKEFGLTEEQLVNDLFGDAVVLAFRDRDPTRKDNREELLLMLHVRDPKLMASVIDKINARQLKSGELKEVSVGEHEKRPFSRRVTAKEDEGDEFYFLRDSVFVFATSEKMMHVAIDRDLKQPLAEKQKPTLTQKFERLGVDSALVVWWMNPRAFDREFTNLVEQSQGIEKAMLTQFAQLWKGFDGVALHFDIRDSIELGAMVSIDKESLPKFARPFFAEGGKPSSLWQAIPENALFALATRMEGGSLLEMFSGMFDPTHRKQVESAVTSLIRVLRPEQLKMLPKGLGPDFGLWVFEPLEDANKKIWVPQAMLAIKLRGGSDGAEAGETLQNGFGLLATFIRLMNGNIAVNSLKDGGDEITYLMYDRGFPAGFRPAFASKGGYFLISASPETIRNFTPPKGGEPKDESEVLFLRVSLKGWKKYLTDHRDGIVNFVAQGSPDVAKEVGSQLDQLAENLTAFDRLELSQRTRKDCVGVTVRLKTTQALRK